MTGDIVKLQKQMRAGLDRAQADLDELRDGIARAKVERDDTLNAPPPRAEIEQRIRAQVDAAGAMFAEGVRGTSVPDLAVLGLTLVDTLKRNPGGFLAWVAGDRLAEQLIANHDAAHGDQPGLSRDERAARLAEIDERLASLEAAEECVVRALERAGVDVLRRGDANPSVVLASDETLAA